MIDRGISRRLGAWIFLATAPVLVTGIRSHPTSRPAAARTVWDSVYSAAQAGRGETAYAKSCARCHGASLTGGDESPPLTGGGFLANWNDLPLSELETRIRTTMPSDSVGIYGRQLVTDVIAFMLKANGFPAGAADLPPDADSLKAIVIRASRPEP
jgi:mono/diheme cytochrome c family protein